MLAEYLGTLLLVAIVVGSGIAAETLSPGDLGLQLLQSSTATALGLFAVIVMVGPVSGAHLNPVVSLADAALGRRTRTGLSSQEVLGYVGAQVAGGLSGALLANAMFDQAAVSISAKERSGAHLWLAEAVATVGLLLLVFALARSGRAPSAPAAVGAYIGAAYWFTSSTSFANPAVTLARTLSDTFAGIAPSSVPAFVVAQLAGLAVAVALVRALYPDVAAAADGVVVPRDLSVKEPA
jgi:arsenate reductase